MTIITLIESLRLHTLFDDLVRQRVRFSAAALPPLVIDHENAKSQVI